MLPLVNNNDHQLWMKKEENPHYFCGADSYVESDSLRASFFFNRALFGGKSKEFVSDIFLKVSCNFMILLT